MVSWKRNKWDNDAEPREWVKLIQCRVLETYLFFRHDVDCKMLKKRNVLKTHGSGVNKVSCISRSILR